MANEIFKELKTRIALKTLSYTEWEAIKDTYKPLKGEVCVCAIPEGNAAATTAPTVMFKVGDGTNFFGALKWASALAADVYGWAKENALFIHKDGTGNVVSGVEWDASLNGGKGGVKYTTAAVATAEGLEELQREVYGENGSADNSRIDKLEKDIADNRDAWNKYEDTRYSFSTDGDKLVVKKTLYTNGVAGAEEAVGTYEFLTADEVAETLEGYYTKGEADGKFVTGLAEGTANGTIKAVVNGVSGDDVKVHGLESAAYVTVDSLNATAKGYADAVEEKLPTSADYGVLEVKGDDASGVVVDNTDAQRPIVKIAANTYDAHGAAAAVLGSSNDAATANTVYGAKAAAAAAQNDATIAKTKIETFLGTVTPDGSQDIIDTLAEINSYVGEHGEEFAALSGRVTKIEDGTTVVSKAADANTLDGHDSTYFATAESVSNISNGLGDLAAKDKVVEGDIDGAIGVGKISGLGALATKDNITHDLVTDFDTAVKAVKVDNAANADKAADADKLGGELPAYYATKASVDAINDVDTGILAQAKKDAGDKAAVVLGEAQEYADEKIAALAGDGNTTTVKAIADRVTTLEGAGYLTEVEADTGLKVIPGTDGADNKVAIDETVVFVLDCNW